MTQTEQSVSMLFLILSIALQIGILSAIQSLDGVNYLKFTYNSSDFTPKKKYDYIIVGGGTVGCPLAATLSESFSVLLIERGGTADENPYVLREENQLLTLSRADNNNSAAETFISEDGVRNARARILGGGTMVNFGIYSRANDDFYYISGINWDMNVVNRSYEWVEDTVTFRPTNMSTWTSSFRNASLEAGILPDNGYTLDHREGTKTTGTIFDADGMRHGSVELLNKADPNNLQVVIHAVTDRIIFSKSSGLSAVGVIYHDSNGKSHKVRVRHKGEVIISAGALGSPQLLLLSGVGPKSYLSSLNITVVYDQPSVGQSMVDNPRNSIFLQSPFTERNQGSQVVAITSDGSYIEPLSGVLPFYSPYDFVLIHGSFPSLNVSMVGFVKKFKFPLSKGWLKLASPTEITSIPIVRFNYFENPTDLDRCAVGMRKIGKMLETQAMERYLFQDQSEARYFKYIAVPLPQDINDDAALKDFCKQTVNTFWHYHGGCLVNQVVDSDLRVHGINSLRVIDGSILTMSPGTNPQATLMMLGRYMGLKLQEARRIQGHDYFEERPFGNLRTSA